MNSRFLAYALAFVAALALSAPTDKTQPTTEKELEEEVRASLAETERLALAWFSG
jgi:DNA-binding IclR family transcriptional regulator